MDSSSNTGTKTSFSPATFFTRDFFTGAVFTSDVAISTISLMIVSASPDMAVASFFARDFFAGFTQRLAKFVSISAYSALFSILSTSSTIVSMDSPNLNISIAFAFAASKSITRVNVHNINFRVVFCLLGMVVFLRIVTFASMGIVSSAFIFSWFGLVWFVLINMIVYIYVFSDHNNKDFNFSTTNHGLGLKSTLKTKTCRFSFKQFFRCPPEGGVSK